MNLAEQEIITVHNDRLLGHKFGYEWVFEANTQQLTSRGGESSGLAAEAHSKSNGIISFSIGCVYQIGYNAMMMQ